MLIPPILLPRKQLLIRARFEDLAPLGLEAITYLLSPLLTAVDILAGIFQSIGKRGEILGPQVWEKLVVMQKAVESLCGREKKEKDMRWKMRSCDRRPVLVCLILFSLAALSALLIPGTAISQGGPVDIADLEHKAGAGDIEAQYRLGVSYLNGEGVERDVHKAAKLLYRSAKGGYAKAYAPLGECYMYGMGVKQNFRRARNCFGTGAKLGDPAAQSYLGMMYQDGIAVRMNYAKAAYWYEKAAVQGDVRAQSSLAVLYEQGQGVTQDFDKAAYWHRKAAEQGDDGSQKNLGDLYSHGMGVEKDYAKAAYWYRKAAAQGNQDALNRVKAIGVPLEEPK